MYRFEELTVSDLKLLHSSEYIIRLYAAVEILRSTDEGRTIVKLLGGPRTPAGQMHAPRYMPPCMGTWFDLLLSHSVGLANCRFCFDVIVLLN